MPTQTTNYDLLKPLVNDATDQDLWGGYLNEDLDDLDSLMKTATDTVHRSVSSATDTATTADRNKIILCDASAAAITVTLPAVADAGDGFKISFKKMDSGTNTVTLDGYSSETIDGSATYIVASQYEAVVLVCDGSRWNIESRVYANPHGYAMFKSTGTITIPAGVSTGMISGIGGGGGGGAAVLNNGSDGGTTSFGSLVSLSGGTGGGCGGSSGLTGYGGTYGGQCGGITYNTNVAYSPSGSGGGINGGAGVYTGAGNSALANTGSGGGGAAYHSGSYPQPAGGGGAGQYMPPTSYALTAGTTYTVTIGAGGAGGAAGGYAGGNGGSGWLLLEW